MFQLTNEEFNSLKSQIVTSNNNYGGIRKLPYVFTEQGIAMLSTILKTEVATEISIKIMDAFVAMRHYISSNLLPGVVEHKLLEHDKRINMLKETFNNFKEKNSHIFFEGQIFDAYSLLIDILKKANKKIVIIDNYAGKELLDILRDLDINIIVVSKNISGELVKKYNAQYENVTFINNTSFHDRFIIIDDKILYHCGSSFKDLGKKCFAISILEDEPILEDILKKIFIL